MGWWRRYLDWRQRHVATVRVDASGLEIRSGRATGGATQQIAWPDICRIVAYKRDIMTTDLLCLAIEGAGTVLELHEEMPGYAEAEAALTSRFALGIEWKLRVMFPAFAPNAETIFCREKARAS